MPNDYFDAFTGAGIDQDNGDYFFIVNWIPNPFFNAVQRQALRDAFREAEGDAALSLVGNYYALDDQEKDI